jgi:hypothetical protein
MNEKPPKLWGRDTPWRQGRVLQAATVAALNLRHNIDQAAALVVVVSHDCDLANDNLDAEPDVEVIVGRLVEAANGNFSWGKAPRTLHLSMTRDGGLVTVELVATSKRLISKRELAQFEPDAGFDLDGQGLAVLRSWLGARYNRSAFPDPFVNRMAATKLDAKLAKTLEPHGALISVVYFDVDGGRIVDREEDSPYALSIVLVYPAGDDPEASADAADEVANAVQRMCEQRLASRMDIVLKNCLAISEEDLPVSRARVLLQWRFEYMTLRANDHPGPVQT